MKAIVRACLLSAVVLMVVTSLVAAVPSARALSPVIWTTTSDFDNGTKSDPGALWFVNNAIDQPSNWIAYPHGWYANGRTYTTYQAGVNYDIYITYYDHATKTWATPVAIVTTNAIRPDGHGSPALGITNDGFLHVFCCSHGTQQDYYRSAAAYDITSWVNKTAALGVNADSYPHIEVLPSGTMYLFYRKNLCGSSGAWAYKTTADSGTTWATERTIIDFGPSPTPCAYVGNTEQRSNRIYMGWSRSSSGVERNIYVGYLDLATDHMFCGVTDLGITIDDTENTASCLAVSADANKETGTCCVVTHTDASNNIYVMYHRQNGTSTFFDTNFTKWTGSSWSAQQFILRTDFFLDLMDFRVLDLNSLEAYITNGGSCPGNSPSNGWTGDITFWTYSGSTWTQGTKLATDCELGHKMINNSEGLSHPQYVRNGQPDLRLIFSTIVTLTTPAGGRIFAYGDGGIVTNPTLTSGTYAVESSTDNPTLTAGAVTLSTGSGDAFAYADADANTWRWAQEEYGTIGTSVHDVASGVLELGVVPTGAGTTNVRLGVASRFRVSGDFDVRVNIAKLDNGASFNSGNFFMLLNEQLASPLVTGTVDGVYYERSADTTLRATTLTNGVGTQVGSSAFPAFPSCERITRATNTITWYYATGACTSWTQHQTTTFVTDTSLFVIFAVWNNGRTDFTARYNFDNYQIAAGSVVSGGTTVSTDAFRRTGSWTSPAINSLGGVTLTYSGLSAAKKIDKVEILSGTTVVQTDDTDIISGTSKSITFPSTGGGNVHVRVTLAGDGTGTPVLEAVQADPVECLNGLSFGSTIFLILPILVGGAILLGIAVVFQPHNTASAGFGLEPAGIAVIVAFVITVLVLVSILAILFGSVWNNVVGAGC